jgi:hypothetical protein
LGPSVKEAERRATWSVTSVQVGLSISLFFGDFLLISLAANVQTNKNTLNIREVSDDLANWARQVTHECGDRQNLIILRYLWRFYEINHMQPVAPLKVFFANPFQVCER